MRKIPSEQVTPVAMIAAILLAFGTDYVGTAAETNRVLAPVARGIATVRPPPALTATMVATNRTFLPLASGVRPESLQVLVRKGTNFEAAPGLVTSMGSTQGIKVPLNQAFIVRNATVQKKVVARNTPIFLPGEVRLHTSNRAIEGRLYIRPETIMMYDPPARAYAARLWVGLASDSPEPIAKALLPLTVRLSSKHLKWSAEEAKVLEPGTAGEVPMDASSKKYYQSENVSARSDLGDQEITLVFQRASWLELVGLFLPVPVLAMAIIGGALGGVLRIRKSTHPWRLIAEGLICGLGIVALIAGGLLLPSGLAPSLAVSIPASFGIALLAGLYGKSVLKKVPIKFFNKNQST